MQTQQFFEEAALSQILIKRIRRLIDGNGILGDELKEISHQFLELELGIQSTWDFYISTNEREVAGGSQSGQHFDSKSEFENYSAKLEKTFNANDSIQTNFINKIAKMGSEALLGYYNNKQFVTSFPTSSYNEKCRACGGSGECRCGDCGGSGSCSCSSGYVRCHWCGGSGTQLDGLNDRYIHCPVCNGRGEESCSHCSGSGQCGACSGHGEVYCSTCKGHGFFTIYADKTIIASPSFKISTKSEKYSKGLLIFLTGQNNSVIYTASAEHFELVDCKALSTNKYALFYKAESFILELFFELLGKQHGCLAFSKNLIIFYRPEIFDDIFADELALIDKINKDGKISQNEAQGFFKKYINQPILNNSFIKIAAKNQDKAEIVRTQCEGFISPAAADKIANFLSKCLNKLSPLYSKMTWVLGTLLFCVLVFLGAELAFEDMPKNQTITSYFLSGIAWTIAFWLFYSLILWGISSVVTALRRRKIPKQYRQKMKNRVAFLCALLAVFVVYVLGCTYGGLAAAGVTPKVQDLLCKISLKQEWHKGSDFWASVCPAPKADKKLAKSTKSTKTMKAAKNSKSAENFAKSNKSANSAKNLNSAVNSVKNSANFTKNLKSAKADKATNSAKYK